MIKMTSGLLVFAALASCVILRYSGPPAPAPIAVKSITEKSIKEDVKHDQRLRAYRRAANAARDAYRKNGCSGRFADLTGRVAVDFGLSPRLLAGLVFVESSCNPNAVSGHDSIGLTQVNPKIWHYSRATLKNPEKNLEIGARILSAYIHTYGLTKGLHAYNGFGNPTNSYAEKVLIAAGIQKEG